MKFANSNDFNVCNFIGELLLLLILCLSSACNTLNDAKIVSSTKDETQTSVNAVNINTATVVELEKLPHIGEQTALQVIEHREKFGRFRKPQHLMMVRGISDNRFRELENLIRVE